MLWRVRVLAVCMHVWPWHVCKEQPTLQTIVMHMLDYTVEPPNKGHFGSGPFVLYSEVVPWSETSMFCVFIEQF